MKKRKFNSKRLKSARLYEGYTIEKLAQSIGVSKQAVSLFEKGEMIPKLETLLKMIHVLQFPKEFFFGADEGKLEIGNVYFRSQLTTNRMAKLSQEEKMKVIVRCHHQLDKYIKFPPLNIPRIEGCDWENVTDEEIEKISLQVRHFWGLGTEPILNVVNLLEKNGIVVVANLGIHEEKIDAYLKRVVYNEQEKYYVVLDESKKSAVRRPFNAAHELGHILIHEAMGVEVSGLSKEQYRKMEQQANGFAASLLLPRESFLHDLIYPTDLNGYIELKKKWKVSIAAMIIRGYKLGVMNRNQYQYLMRKMNAQGYRVKEPLDHLLHMNKPTLFQKAVDLMITNKILSPSNLLTKFCLFQKKAETLLGLEADTLLERESHDNLFELSFHRRFDDKMTTT